MQGRLSLSRRQSLQGLAILSLGAFGGHTAGLRLASVARAAEDMTDEDIFQFALNLEYAEAEYYLRATTGEGISDADIGSNPGKVVGGRKVPFEHKPIREFAEELAAN